MNTITSAHPAFTGSNALQGRLGTKLVFAGLIIALVTWSTPPVALLAGIVFSLCLGNPFARHAHHFAKLLLQVCVVMLGFGMDLPVILRAGWHGSLFAAATIGATLLLGYWIGNRLAINRNVSILISAGTAICGGSAIAAVGSVLAVTEGEIAVAMGTVFLLNAAALYLFPLLGHALHLSQHQFGVWAGVAIHDISSVIGASLAYGNDALETATAVKLSRTLWIIPITLGLVIATVRKERLKNAAGPADAISPPACGKKMKVEIPWFIACFLLASMGRSGIPAIAVCAPQLAHVAKGGLTIVLCLIGASLTPKALRTVGWQAALQGVLLWIFISIASLLAIIYLHVGQ